MTILAFCAVGKFAGLAIPALAKRGAVIRGLVREPDQVAAHADEISSALPFAGSPRSSAPCSSHLASVAREPTSLSNLKSLFCGVTRVMNSPDQETVLRAIEDARRILGDYIKPGQSDAARTVEHLIAVLDKNDVVHALDRMTHRRVLRLAA